MVAEVRTRAADPERGSATVLMLAVAGLAGFLIMVTLVTAGAIVARHRAGAIADLAALAAAGAPGPGSGALSLDGGAFGPDGGAFDPDACARARRVAAANAGRLTGCRFPGDGSVVVDVELPVRGLPVPARGSARAGPGPAGGEEG